MYVGDPVRVTPVGNVVMLGVCVLITVVVTLTLSLFVINPDLEGDALTV